MSDNDKKEKNKLTKLDYSGQNKLDSQQKKQVIAWLAEGYTPKEIADNIKEKYNIDYTRQSVAFYKENYKDEIIKIRQELNYNIKDRVALANKGIRVKKLSEVAGKALRANNFQEFRLHMKLIAEEMGDLQDNIIIKGEVQGLIGQLVTIIQHEVSDVETVKKIAERLQGADL